jgi:hypothetical protein
LFRFEAKTARERPRIPQKCVPSEGGLSAGRGNLTEGLDLLLGHETSYRNDKRLASRLRYANLRHQAIIEDADYRHPRNLDGAQFQRLAAGHWIEAHDNLILCAETGIGKSPLACALGHKACRDNRSVFYQRVRVIPLSEITSEAFNIGVPGHTIQITKSRCRCHTMSSISSFDDLFRCKKQVFISKLPAARSETASTHARLDISNSRVMSEGITDERAQGLIQILPIFALR